MGVNQRGQIVLTDEELQQLLAGSRTMTMATIAADGQPHLVAMWFALIDGDVCFETKAKSQKAVNLRRDPRITCLVEDGTTYEDLRGAAIEGRAEVTDDLKPMVEAMLNKRVAVRVKADRVRSWDHRKLGMGSTGAPAGSTVEVPGRRPR